MSSWRLCSRVQRSSLVRTNWYKVCPRYWIQRVRNLLFCGLRSSWLDWAWRDISCGGWERESASTLCLPALHCNLKENVGSAANHYWLGQCQDVGERVNISHDCKISTNTSCHDFFFCNTPFQSQKFEFVSWTAASASWQSSACISESFFLFLWLLGIEPMLTQLFQRWTWLSKNRKKVELVNRNQRRGDWTSKRSWFTAAFTLSEDYLGKITENKMWKNKHVQVFFFKLCFGSSRRWHYTNVLIAYPSLSKRRRRWIPNDIRVMQKVAAVAMLLNEISSKTLNSR